MDEKKFQLLDKLYRSILLRPMDPSGYQTYSAMLHDGKTTLDDIADILRGSEEYERLQDAINHDTCYEMPHRSPLAVSDAIADLLAGKLVCEIGAAEGDNMIALGRHADQVVGFERDPLRCQQAKGRGLDVLIGDYWHDPLPPAEVYFAWPTDGGADNEFLITKLLADASFHGTIVIAADASIPPELVSVRRCGRIGEIRTVPYDEGIGERQKGIMLLAVIDVDTARAQRNQNSKGESRVITTLALGRDMEPLAAITLPGIEAYADATGADLSVITQGQINDPSPFYEIFQIARLFSVYDRVMYVDLDIVIREGTPDLFEIVPPDHLGVFMECRMQTRQIVEFFRGERDLQKLDGGLVYEAKSPPGLVADRFNNGVSVMSKRHRYLFDPPDDVPEWAKGNDQEIMNIRATEAEEPIFDITEAFNFMVCMLDEKGEGHRRAAWMIHYGSLPLAVKIENAQLDLARWKANLAPPVDPPFRNRLFNGLKLGRTPGLSLGKQGEFWQLHNSAGEEQCRMSDLESQIWQKCDGIITVEELMNDIRKYRDDDESGRDAFVIEFLNRLLECQLVVPINQYVASDLE